MLIYLILVGFWTLVRVTPLHDTLLKLSPTLKHKVNHKKIKHATLCLPSSVHISHYSHSMLHSYHSYRLGSNYSQIVLYNIFKPVYKAWYEDIL